LFVKDLATGAITLASASASGEQANDGSNGSASLAADGRFVAFASSVTNLVPGLAAGAYLQKPFANARDRMSR
jgi:hypothetical protein